MQTAIQNQYNDDVAKSLEQIGVDITITKSGVNTSLKAFCTIQSDAEYGYLVFEILESSFSGLDGDCSVLYEGTTYRVREPIIRDGLWVFIGVEDDRD